MSVTIKSAEEIELMRQAGKYLAKGNWNVQSNLESAHGRLIKSEKRPSAALAANRIS